MRTGSRHVDKKLSGYEILTEVVSSETECMRICLKHQSQCRSVNIYKDASGQTKCDINSVAVDDGAYSLCTQTDSFYYGPELSTCG